MIYLFFCFNQPGRNFFEAKINSGHFNRIISLCQFAQIKLSIFIGDLIGLLTGPGESVIVLVGS